MKLRFCLLLLLSWALFTACQTPPSTLPPTTEQTQPLINVTLSATALPATATALPTLITEPPTTTPTLPPTDPTWHRPDPAAYQLVFNQLHGVEAPSGMPSWNDQQLFEQFLQRDKELYFADGWPSALTFFTTPPAEKLQLSNHDNLLTDIVLQGFIEYLNEEKIDLNQQTSLQTEASQATFTPIDLKGDGSAYWLVKLHNEYLHSINKTGLLMVITQDNTGVYLVEKILWAEYFPPEDYQIFITDVAGSPAVDLVIFMTWYMSLGRPELLLVYSAEAEEIILVEVIELSSPEYPFVTYDLKTDVTGDNRPDIQINYPLESNFDCVQGKVVTYSWVMDSLEAQIEEKPAEETALCTLLLGMVQQDPQLLENSLAQIEGFDSAMADLKAINLIHLGMAYFGQGNLALAQETLAQIEELPAAVIPNLAQQAYQHAPRNPLEFCRFLTQHAQEAIDSEIAGFLVESAVLTPSFIGNSKKIYQPYICPLEATANTILHQNPLVAAENPITQLTNYGFEVLWSQEIQLNKTPTLEWVLFTEEVLDGFLTLEAITTTWQLERYSINGVEIETVELHTKDVTGDGVEDVFGLFTTTDCPSASNPPYSRVIMFYTSEDKFYSEPNGCSAVGEPTPDQFYASAEPPTWQQVEELAEKYQIDMSGPPTMLFSNFIHSLTTLALAGELPAGVIDDTIAQFPKNDPAVEPYHAQLLFMQGYHHEQQGETDQALVYYLALINNYPTSLWSLLAQTRVFIP